MTPHRRFLAALAAALLLANLAALLAPRRLLGSRWFLEHADDHYAMMLAHHLGHAGERNDVVLLGDSAGMMGVDAALVGAASGRSAVNLSLYGFAGFDAWRLLIDHYLDHNAAPRLVVLYIVPMSLAINEEADHARFSYETAQLVYRLDSWAALLARGRQLPAGLGYVWSVVARAAGNALESWWRPARRDELRAHRQAVDDYARASHGGSRMELVKAGWSQRVLDERCAFDAVPALPLDGLAALRRHLEERGLRVVLYVAPTPACDHALARYRAVLGPLAANTIAQRPSGDFYDRSHMTAAACADHSRALGAFVAGAL